MKIILFGATGHTGSYILDEALKAGHQVSVLVRNANKVGHQRDKLNIITGDALNEDDVVRAVEGQDAVLSAISEGPYIEYKTQSRAVGNMIKAMKKTGVKRILCMGAIGILQHNEHELIRDQDFYAELYKPLSHEHSEVNRLLNESGLDWTQVCPPTIVGMPADGNFLLKADYPPSSNKLANAGNIGLFMMQELEKNEFIGKRVGITNA
jgi:uncharacterized protein